MKKNCIIINAARGGIVNEVDLDRALNENLIFGAGLDVFETEPPAENNPLLKNKKVFLSPHTAAFTEECMTRMGKETIQNIFDFFDGSLENSKKSKDYKAILRSISVHTSDKYLKPFFVISKGFALAG